MRIALEIFIFVPYLFLVFSCSSSSSKTNHLFVYADSSTHDSEIALSEINEAISLESSQQDQEYFGYLLYQRGVILDSLGLRLLASVDFHKSLEHNPNIYDSYNFLGVYYTQDGLFSQANEYFNSSFKINPQGRSVYLNRSIANYYNEDYNLALDDMNKFNSMSSEFVDPNVALWVYILKYAINKQEAFNYLSAYYNDFIASGFEKNNIFSIIEFYLQDDSVDKYLDSYIDSYVNVDNIAESMCYFYFYQGKKKQLDGDYYNSIEFFNKAIQTNFNKSLEYKYSKLEIKRSIGLVY